MPLPKYKQKIVNDIRRMRRGSTLGSAQLFSSLDGALFSDERQRERVNEEVARKFNLWWDSCVEFRLQQLMDDRG